MSVLSRARIFVTMGVALLLLACNAATPTPTPISSGPTPPPTSKPTATPVPATATPRPTVTPTVQPTPAPQPTATATPRPTPTPVAPPPSGVTGGSLTIAGLADIPHRDFHQSVQETLTSLGPGLAYSRLLRLRTGPEQGLPSLLLECDLCLSWEMTSDLSYEFRLRPDVHWQDISPVNGRLLVAEDLSVQLRAPENAGLAKRPFVVRRG